MYGAGHAVPIQNIIYGLGGRMLRPEEIETVFRDLVQIAESGKVTETCKWLGVRE